jgi:predicted transcriptional regulator
MRRNKQDIIYDMLKAVQSKGGSILSTHLLYKSNLSHSKMKDYLEELMGKELLEYVEFGEKQKIKMTDKGFKFLQSLRQLREFTEAFGI